MDSAVRRLLRSGHVRIRFPFSELVGPVIAGYRELLTRPLGELDPWCIDHYGNGDPDDGLIHRVGGEHDRKFFFHWRPRLPHLLAARGIGTAEHRSWFDACNALFHASRDQMLLGMDALDRALPGHRFAQRARLLDSESDDVDALRLLWYEDTIEDGVIARQHTDRSAFTLHLADNVPGLVLGNKRGGKLAPTEPGEGILFPGKQVEQLVGKKLRALPHSAQHMPGYTEKRWVIVFFFKLFLGEIPVSVAEEAAVA